MSGLLTGRFNSRRRHVEVYLVEIEDYKNFKHHHSPSHTRAHTHILSFLGLAAQHRASFTPFSSRISSLFGVGPHAHSALANIPGSQWLKNTVGWNTVQPDVGCPSEVASQALNMGWRGEGVDTRTHTHTHA